MNRRTFMRAIGAGVAGCCGLSALPKRDSFFASEAEAAAERAICAASWRRPNRWSMEMDSALIDWILTPDPLFKALEDMGYIQRTQPRHLRDQRD